MHISTRAIDALRGLKHPLTARLGLLLSLFIVLMLVAYAASAWAVGQMAYDGFVLNVAGRQRALIQQYTRQINRSLMALAISDWETLLEEKSVSASTARFFETTHQAFLEGGVTRFGAQSGQELRIPRTNNEHIREHLDHVSRAWSELKRVAGLALRSDAHGLRDNEHINAMQAQCASTAAHMGQAVSQMQHASDNKLRRIEVFQTVTTALGCLLLVGIMFFVHFKIVAPLDRASSDLATKNRELALASARIRAIVDGAADGIITIDERGIIESFNAAAERTFGYAADEVVGESVNMLMPSPYREEHDGHLQKYCTGGVKRIIDMRREVVGRRKDGSTFPMDLHVSEVRLGDRRSFTGIIRDITKRKLAEEEIARQNRFLNTVIESLDHPFLVIDAEDCLVLMANAAARRDAPPQAKTCHAMTHRRDTPCDGADDECPLAEVKRTGRSVMVEHTHYQADGSPRAVEVHAYPVFDGDGRVVQVIEYSLDITKRKRTEAKLQQAKQAAEAARDALKESVEELETFNFWAVGRELRMIELKKEVNELSESGGEAPRYEIVDDEVAV